MTKRLKIAYGCWAIAVLGLIISLANGTFEDMVGGGIIFALAGLYFYKTKDKPPKKKKEEDKFYGYTVLTLPKFEPVINGLEIDIFPDGDINSKLVRFAGSSWNGSTKGAAIRSIKDGVETYVYEYSPFSLVGSVKLPEEVIYTNPEERRKFLENTYDLPLTVSANGGKPVRIGRVDGPDLEAIREMLINKGYVFVYVNVYGGNCVFMSVVKEVEEVKEELSYKIEVIEEE